VCRQIVVDCVSAQTVSVDPSQIASTSRHSPVHITDDIHNLFIISAQQSTDYMQHSYTVSQLLARTLTTVIAAYRCVTTNKHATLRSLQIKARPTSSILPPLHHLSLHNTAHTHCKSLNIQHTLSHC